MFATDEDKKSNKSTFKVYTSKCKPRYVNILNNMFGGHIFRNQIILIPAM